MFASVLLTTTDTTERLVIEMQILSHYRDLIRKNSNVQVRPGVSLIGAPVVSITVGTTSASRLADGDTLRALAEIIQRPHAGDIATIGDSVIAIAGGVRQLAAQIHATTQGPIAQVRQRSTAQIAAVERAIRQFSNGGARSHGTSRGWHAIRHFTEASHASPHRWIRFRPCSSRVGVLPLVDSGR